MIGQAALSSRAARWRWYAALTAYGALPASIVAAAAVALLLIGGLGWLLPNLDFMGTYLGAHLVATGEGRHLYDFATQTAVQTAIAAPQKPILPLLFLYPAWNAVLLAPLGALPYPIAFFAWFAGNTLALALGLRRLIPASATGSHARTLLTLVALGFMPACLALATGQVAILVWLSLTGAVLALRRGQDRVAGAWLLLGLLKPQLILLPVLGLVVARRWRALAVFAAGGAAVALLSLAVLGNWIPSYLALLNTYLAAGKTLGDNVEAMLNWRTFVYRLLGTEGGPIAAPLITALSLVTVVAALLIGARARAHAARGLEVAFAVSLILGLLIDPHVYLYDATIVLTAGFLLWRLAQGEDRRTRWLRRVLAAGPFIAWLTLWEPVIPIELGSSYFLVLLVCVARAWPVLTAGPAPAPALLSP